MMPLIMLLVLPWAATFEQHNIRLCVIDNDRSPLSNRLVNELAGSKYFKVAQSVNSYDEALAAIEKGDVDLILEIPHNFNNNIFREKKINFMLDIDAVNGQKASIGLSYITQIVNRFVANIFAQQKQNIPTIEIKQQYRYNERMEYFPFMVPGIFVILLTTMTTMSTALNIVHEKEDGTIEQINVTPITKATFIIGKIIPFWIIGIVVLTIGILVGLLIYRIVPVGNLLNLYLVAFIYIISISGLGLIISNIAETQQQAMLLIFFTLMVFILLGGLFTPISSMPDWAQRITWFNPFRYLVECVRLIYLKGSGLKDVLPNIVKLICFAIVLNTLAIISYRKRNA